MGKRGPKGMGEGAQAARGNPSKRRRLPNVTAVGAAGPGLGLTLLEGGGGIGAVELVPLTVVPRCPAHLGTVGKHWFRKVARELVALRLLTALDLSLLERMARLYEKWRWAEHHTRHPGDLIKTGAKGFDYVNPAAYMALKAGKEFDSLAAVFGMGPGNRAQIAELIHRKPKSGQSFEELMALRREEREKARAAAKVGT